MKETISLSERLVRVETKVESIKELLEGIRDDLKTQPSRSEFKDLKERLLKVESRTNGILVKVGTVAGVLSLIAGFIINSLMRVLL